MSAQSEEIIEVCSVGVPLSHVLCDTMFTMAWSVSIVLSVTVTSITLTKIYIL